MSPLNINHDNFSHNIPYVYDCRLITGSQHERRLINDLFLNYQVPFYDFIFK